MAIIDHTIRIAAIGGRLFLSCFRCYDAPLRASNVISLNIVICLLTPCLPNAAAASGITLSSDTSTATAGYFQLSWRPDPPVKKFVLQESDSSDFSSPKVIYRGSDLATVISGKKDRIYFYRVSEHANPANTSNIVKVTVAHHPLTNAFFFFGIGAIVFIATVLLILHARSKGY